MHGPFEHVHVDLAGPFICSTAGIPAMKYHVLVVPYYFTKMAEFVPITSKEAVVVVQHFYNQWICRVQGIGREFQDDLQRFERHRTRGVAHRSGRDLSVADYVLELSDSALSLCAEARGADLIVSPHSNIVVLLLFC